MWPSATKLQSARLLLEPLCVMHAEEAATALADESLHRYIGGHPATTDELRDRYARQVAGHSPDGRHGWLNWILRERRSGQLAGTLQATLSRAVDGGHSAELAWIIATDHRGQGLAAEAATAVTARLFDQGTVALVAHVHPGNVASAATAARLGMTPTPVLEDGEIEWRGDLRQPSC